MQKYLLPFAMGSASGRALANELGIVRLRRQGSNWRYRDGRGVINWGVPTRPDNIPEECPVLNSFEAVNLAANKIKAFEALENTVSIPAFFTDKEEAIEYMLDNECSIVCRTVLRGNSGEGIVIADRVDEVVDAPLYTAYIKKTREYRVHIFQGIILDVQRKARKLDVPDDQIDWRVRNLANGFIYAREGFDTQPQVFDTATNAVRKLGLDFGAVDIIWNERKQQEYVLEVNTAPGLEGTTLARYGNAMLNWNPLGFRANPYAQFYNNNNQLLEVDANF